MGKRTNISNIIIYHKLVVKYPNKYYNFYEPEIQGVLNGRTHEEYHDLEHDTIELTLRSQDYHDLVYIRDKINDLVLKDLTCKIIG